jgi:hypothetical protein
MSTWIKARVTFPKRRAHLAIADELLRDPMLVAIQGGETTRLEAMCAALLAVAFEGRYAGATLYGLHFDLSRLCWVLALAHPALPATAPGAQAPELTLDLSAAQMAAILWCLRPPLGPLEVHPPADLQGERGTLDRLHDADEQPNEFAPPPPRPATELRELGHIPPR